MEAHQPRDRFCFRRIKSEARTELGRDFRADHTVVAATAFGDVMEQNRDVEDTARGNLLVEYRGRKRVLFLELATLDGSQQADCADRMLVDSIVVVHVELHLCDHSAKI